MCVTVQITPGGQLSQLRQLTLRHLDIVRPCLLEVLGCSIQRSSRQILLPPCTSKQAQFACLTCALLVVNGRYAARSML